MPLIIQKLISAFVSKKRIIGWVSAVVFAIGAVLAGFTTQEFKDAVCGAPVITQAPPAPASTEAK